MLQKVFNTQWDKVMPVLYFIFKNFNCYSTEFMRFLFLHRSFLDHLTFTTKSVVCTQIHVHTVHHKTCYYSYIDIKAKESLKKGDLTVSSVVAPHHFGRRDLSPHDSC